MATDESTPRWSTEDRILLRTAAELLEAGEYERLAELLDRVRSTSDREGDPVAAHTLDLARRICMACSQSQAEAEWHQQARAQAAQREDRLRDQLDALLHLDGAGDRSPADLPAQVEAPSLWQRIQGMLHQRPEPRIEEAIPAQPVEAPSLPPQEPEPPTPPAPPVEGVIREDPGPPSHEPRPEAAAAPSGEPAMREEPDPPSLAVYCLGQFRVYQDDKPVDDWPSSKGKAIFKYLVTHRERPVVKEVLMELFWPGAHPDAARNNLNVAIYGMRQALRAVRPDFSHVLFQDDCYCLNPDLQVWIDVEAFAKHCKLAQDMKQRGEQAAAFREYHAAEALYGGEFLEEDRYEDWLFPQRSRYQDEYLKLLDCLSRCYFDNGDYAACITMCRKMLSVDPCREEAHRRLMRCFSRQGQAHLALRQYHLCLEKLGEELEVTPAPTTVELYDRVRNRKRI